MIGIVETQAFREAMSRLGAAVNVITTAGPGGTHGMTASAVCSVSDEPASLLLCINRTTRMNAILKKNGRFAVNVLGAAQQDVSRMFADPRLAMDERFTRCGPRRDVCGDLPGLSDALAVIGCSIESVSEVGTHSVFIGVVEELVLGRTGSGLVYYDRAYHHLAASGGAGS